MSGIITQAGMFRNLAEEDEGPSYLVSEDCEGTGTPSGWTDGGGINWGYTAAPLIGSKSLFIDAQNFGSFANYTEKTFAAQDSVYLYCPIRRETTPSNDGWFILFKSGASIIVQLAITSGDAFKISINGSGTSLTGTTEFLPVTTYHLWVHVPSDDVVGVFLSSTATKPGSPTFVTNFGPGASAIDTINFMANRGSDVIVDKIRVSAIEIGSDPV